MNKLSLARRAEVLSCLVDGVSIRATTRITGAAKNTIVKLLESVGAACARYQDETLVNLPCKRIQVDEIWTFVGCKEKHVPFVKDTTRERFDWLGDAWTWTAICADTKLVPSFLVGSRDADWAHLFMQDVASRLRNRVQLTSDGHKSYLTSVPAAFGVGGVDYAQIVKTYGCYVENDRGERRYSPSTCTGFDIVEVFGEPKRNHISTSYMERANLTMRMSMRRFTRLTNAFSRKVENHRHSVALNFMYYNFGRRHMTIRTTPAHAAGVSPHVWSLAEIADLPQRYPEVELQEAA
jgi:IS1 family transposase